MARRTAWLLFALAMLARAAPARADDPPATAPPPSPIAKGSAAPTPRALGTPEPPPPSSDAPTATPTASSPPLFDFSSDDTPDYFTKRYEPAGFPLVGGNSDIGFQFGGVLTLTKFGDGTRPYAWNMDIVLSASVKSLPTGLGIAQQSYLWQWDVPGLAEGKLRLNPAAQYIRTINAGYFGLGNASSAARPTGSTGTYFQYVHQEAAARHITRYAFAGPFDLMFATTLRYTNPGAYAGSRLATDAAAHAAGGGPLLIGVEPLGMAGQAAGVVYDSRNSEVFPKHGAFHQAGIRYVQGLNDTSARYGEAGAIFANFNSLVGPFVLATRAVFDFEFGRVPFFDLYNGGVFVPDQLPGGSAGIRGVPEGRYLGPIKVIGNLELRAMWGGFHLLGQSFHVGNTLFFDTGRVWSDYSFRSPLDGKGLGFKWGSGLGAYLLWGQAAIFRLEVAYSPDAEAENPGFPFGIYVEDGVMF